MSKWFCGKDWFVNMRAAVAWLHSYERAYNQHGGESCTLSLRHYETGQVCATFEAS